MKLNTRISAAQATPALPNTRSGGGLSQPHWEMIHLCAGAAQAIGLPRSVGEIFGFVFSASTPVTFDNVVTGLSISNGSASHGLRFLRRLGAVKVAFLPGNRRDFYQVETSLHKIASGFLAETILHRLGGLSERLLSVESSVRSSADPVAHVLAARVDLLKQWNNQAGAALDKALTALR